MNKQLIRNIFWIALVAVWSFLAGAYFHLGWVRGRSMSYQEGFVIGGIGVWIVFVGMGILIYRFAKNNGSADPAKLSLGVVSFFTVCFLLIAWVKYDDVKKDKFIEEIEHDFVLHYQEKALEKQLNIKDLYWELDGMYSSIHYDLRRHPQLEKLMQLKTEDAFFEQNTVIAKLCVDFLKTSKRLGYPPASGLEELFE
ncbi:hypothetical protein [Fluviicola taffensis]|uniref:Uncharacterized protein n=1 Tax=Fluviicola taffensis (strain DSM 16823 / NCIMB 13979 / RW262) TaxID=755732 RepID=F2IA23_FLUTR|nr:hypothetical protein [Fluviicola taffensis]AEA45200.1 hypothetical protein Fluta_3227 [Fluviicola taffensis DSM 16823]